MRRPARISTSRCCAADSAGCRQESKGDIRVDTQHGRCDDGSYAAWDFGDNPGPESDGRQGDGFGQDSGAFLDFGDGTSRDHVEPVAIQELVVDEPAGP